MKKNEGYEARVAAARETMKCRFDEEFESDQQRKLPAPPCCKPAMSEGEGIALTKEFAPLIVQGDYLTLLENRRSCWQFEDADITLEQLAFLLWSSQGVQKQRQVNTLRPSPSGGSRHPFESYVVARRVQGLRPGVYHYLPLHHTLELVRALPEWDPIVSDSLAGQAHHAHASALVYWTCEAYRGEWRYSYVSHRVMLMDVGHLCQNLYLSATALGLAACGIAAYHQALSDALLGVDGVEEYTTYVAAVGLRKEQA